MPDGKMAVPGSDEIAYNIREMVKRFKDIIMVIHKDGGSIQASSISLPQKVIYSQPIDTCTENLFENKEFVENIKDFDTLYVCGVPVDGAVSTFCLNAVNNGRNVKIAYNACRGIEKNIGNIALAYKELKKNKVQPVDARIIFEKDDEP